MKKTKILSLVAAALLTVAPVVTTVTTGSDAVQVVKAAEMSPSQLMQDYYDSYDSDDLLIKLTKTTPYLSAYSGETVNSLSKKQIKDVRSNYGHVSKMTSMDVYKTNDEGRPDLGQRLKHGQKLQSNGSYVAALRFDVTSFPKQDNDQEYTFFSQNPYHADEYDLEESHAWAGDSAGDVTLLVPVHVDGRKPTKSSTYGYITTRKRNSRVRTYTSSGKFSRHYVYGHHTYRVSSKRHIKHHGTCYKLYGKNQWIPKKYVSIR